MILQRDLGQPKILEIDFHLSISSLQTHTGGIQKIHLLLPLFFISTSKIRQSKIIDDVFFIEIKEEQRQLPFALFCLDFNTRK